MMQLISLITALNTTVILANAWIQSRINPSQRSFTLLKCSKSAIKDHLRWIPAFARMTYGKE
jgi:hypothetical protein